MGISHAEISEQHQGGLDQMPIHGRFHNKTRKLEDDYIVSSTVLGSGRNGYAGQIGREQV
jgi:hypothetical protein